MKKKYNIEICSPAGSFESLMAAIYAGAQSVYIGVLHLNMRSQSIVNFSLTDLRRVSAICKKHRVKFYIAINTAIYDRDLTVMKKIIDAAVKNQADAVIVTDQAAMNYARLKKIPVHLSTQLNISNIETIRFYAGFADVMVLARELSLQQIKKIITAINKENIRGPSGEKVRIEVFVHGALCMSISGKCYLSLHEYNKSANRGECLQLCRRKYIVRDKETDSEFEVDNQYILSPKDLCTIGFIDRIADAGVSVFKIEGRARSPEYVKITTRCYSEAIHALNTSTYTAQKILKWKTELATVFNRGFWDGYYLGQKLGEWNDAYGSKATKKKTYTGKITNYFAKIKVAEMLIETGTVKLNDSVLIIGKTTGVIEMTITELRDKNGIITKAGKGIYCSFPVSQPVRRSDKVYLFR